MPEQDPKSPAADAALELLHEEDGGLRTVPTPEQRPSPRLDHGGALGLYVIYSEASCHSAYLLARGEEAGIGRNADNRIVLNDDAAVSRNHARVFWQGEIPCLRDLGSTNGSWVNGARIEQSALLPESVLRIGNTVFGITTRELASLTEAQPTATVDEYSELVGGAWLHQLRAQLVRIARSEISVVIHGESGTGKEPLARELHTRSARRGAFVAVNCTALPATLIESELFGYKRGAFSGATTDKPGLVRAADGGTLFLDEIGDMPLAAQAKLLRVLQEREVVPLGATRPEPVDLRVVCATHRDLEQAVHDGTFRGDLMARVRQYVVRLPPLRERRRDLVPLVRHFLEQAGASQLRLTTGLMEALACHAFPYNVRELKSAIQVAATLATTGELSADHLPTTVRATPSEPLLPSSRPARVNQSAPAPSARKPSRAPSETELRTLLTKHAGNISAVSRELRKDRVQIHRWLRRYGIDPSTLRD